MAKREVVQTLQKGGVLDALRWAHWSAYEQVSDDYNPDGGHDQAWIGLTAHKYLVDRQHRVFSTGRFSLDQLGASDADGQDVIANGIRDEHFRLMPRIRAGSVVRCPLNTSPGWAFGELRWLMTSFTFGQVAAIRWPRKSATKVRLAKDAAYDGQEEALFELGDFDLLHALDKITDPPATLRNTFVLAHAMDAVTRSVECYLGRSRWNLDRGNPWVWIENLERLPRRGGPRGLPLTPEHAHDLPSTSVPDVPVRLRHRARVGRGEGASRGNGSK